MLKLSSFAENRQNYFMLLPALILALQIPAADAAVTPAPPSMTAMDPAAAGNAPAVPSPPELAETPPAPAASSPFYSPEAYPELIAGRDLILNRQYDEARARFRAYGREHPKDVTGPVGVCIALTAQYLESKSDDLLADLRQSVKEAKSRFDGPAPEGKRRAGWHFLRAVVYGNEALLEFWDDSHFAAYRRAQDALSELDSAKDVAPEFADPELGFGLYQYVLSDKLGKILFFLPDNRKKGIKKLEEAADAGQFAGPIAEISLMWIYRKERRTDEADRTGESIERRYPKNIIAMILRAQTQSDRGRHDEAARIFTRMASAAPDFPKSWFYRGEQYFEMEDYTSAREDLERYLAASPVDRKKIAEAHVMLGRISELTGDETAADLHYRTALVSDPKNPRAKRGLGR